MMVDFISFEKDLFVFWSTVIISGNDSGGSLLYHFFCTMPGYFSATQWVYVSVNQTMTISMVNNHFMEFTMFVVYATFRFWEDNIKSFKKYN